MGISAGMNPMWKLVGIAVGLVVIALLGAMSILGANNSANLASASSNIAQFIGLIGLAIAVGILTQSFRGTR